MRIALVVFRGELGGAEIVTAELASALRKNGVDANVVFALTADALAERLRAKEVPYREVGMLRHRDVLYHPRRLAQMVSKISDGAILVECGYLGVALRAGGYRGRIVGVEHGPLLELKDLPLPRRTFMRLARLANARADDIDVAVSRYVMARLQRSSHARRTECIHNGVDLADYRVAAQGRFPNRPGRTSSRARTDETEPIVLGSAGRLVAGKGFDVLLRSLSALSQQVPGIVLRLAGDGRELNYLRGLSKTLGVTSSLELLGPVNDIPAFWRSCDIAVTPSDTFPESFSMVTLEAMATGLPVVATRNGGIPEVVLDGTTGTLVPPGDVDALTEAVLSYIRDPIRRASHAQAARQRCEECFDIRKVAQRYLALFEGSESSSASSGAGLGPP